MKTIFLFLAVVFSLPTWAADMPKDSIVKATLVAENTGIAPGQPFTVGIVLDAKEGWHTYWENPGDAGMATNFEWTLPEGFSASPIDWPPPQRETEGPLVIFSYTGKVFLPVTITPPATLGDTSYPLKAKASWLVCKDICIPESANLEITLPVATPAPSPSAALFEKHRQQAPQKIGAPASYHSDGHTLTFVVPLAELKVKEIHAALFFPRQQNIIRYASEQKLATGRESLRLGVDKADDAADGEISGILSLTVAGNEQKYFDITFESGAIAPATPSPAAAEESGQTLLSLPLLMLLAALGGLILNLMPCVLPVLSLKALAIVKKSGQEHAAVRRQGIAYTLGILVSFAVIAGILLGLRQTGAVIGWGYQMQSPAFVGFLIYLLFIVGLSLSGLFHLPVLLGSTHVPDESSAKGSFFTGVLATAVATPCTAPFMASAVGVALTLSPFEAIVIFESLGFGLALPFLLISWFPRLRRFLPTPGAWMETFKELLAFPMYASVIWLLWVLTLQTGAGGMAIAACGLLAILIAIWMKRLFPEGRGYRITALVIYALVLALSLPALGRMEIGGMEHKMEDMGIGMADYSKEKLAELRAAGKPVFVDATAAWCITCQLNGRTTLHSERVMQAFKDKGVTLMVADWTRPSDAITEFLESFGYKGVPLYVFYPADCAIQSPPPAGGRVREGAGGADGSNNPPPRPSPLQGEGGVSSSCGGKPVVLPQLLTEDIVVSILGDAPAAAQDQGKAM